MAVADASRRASRECVEASILVEGAAVTLVLRDTGVTSDVTDVDSPVTSLRRFVISSMMREQQSRRYLNTVGCNRAVLVFRRDKPFNSIKDNPKLMFVLS